MTSLGDAEVSILPTKHRKGPGNRDVLEQYANSKGTGRRTIGILLVLGFGIFVSDFTNLIITFLSR
jgi:hypothetical protein